MLIQSFNGWTTSFQTSNMNWSIPLSQCPCTCPTKLSFNWTSPFSPCRICSTHNPGNHSEFPWVGWTEKELNYLDTSAISSFKNWTLRDVIFIWTPVIYTWMKHRENDLAKRMKEPTDICNPSHQTVNNPALGWKEKFSCIFHSDLLLICYCFCLSLLAKSLWAVSRLLTYKQEK